MQFIDGLNQSETPVALDDGDWLIVEMGGAETGAITRIAADGSTASRVAPAARPNGVAVDADQNVWICEAGRDEVDVPASLNRMKLDGSEFEVVLDGFQGQPFKLPNDLVFGPDGWLYFTDSGASTQELIEIPIDDVEFDGRVYRYDPRSAELELLDSGIHFINGIAWGVEDDVFYTVETLPGTITRYRIDENGEVIAKNVLGSVMDPDREYEGIAGPDGFAVAGNGDLYVTVFGQSIITVMAPDGSVKERIETEAVRPTNCAFADGKLYVTSLEGAVEVFDVGVEGAPIHR